VIQHEIDHLNGILFVDHITKDDLKKVKTMLRRIQKRKVETEYPLYNPDENDE
jgi:peptide deformylase